MSDTNKHRVFRIRDPLGTPKVDVIIGQSGLGTNDVYCNRTPPGGTYPNPVPLNYLCKPGSLSFDNFNNLYVSDHSLEVEGNHRLLIFPPSLFPTNNITVNYDKTATKEFPNNGHHYAFETAFDSQNHMVMGQNSYSKRFFPYYLNPIDPNAKTPDGYFEDFVGMTYGVTFDSQDNLYVTDINRTSVKIYKKPFVEPNGTQPPDQLANEAPSVDITSHDDNAWYKGGVHKLKANIHDDYQSIAKVEFLVDGNLINTDYFEPFEADHNFSSLDGNHTVVVKAYDNFNRTGQSSITVKIDHQGPGKDVIWNSPTNGSTVSGRIPVSINADDLVSGTKKVEFLVDGDLVATDNLADSFGFWWNTSSVSNGSHTLSAKAYDQPENVTTISITVNVNNSSSVANPTNQIYLTPSNQGTYGEYSEQRLYPLNALEEFEAFDEEVPDDLWSYLFTNGDNVRFRSSGKIDSSQIPPGTTINNVEVYARARSAAGSPNLKIMLRVGGSDYFSGIIPITSSSFIDYKNIWTTNPANGSAWTASALANAEIGVQAWHATANAHHVTAVWMVVNTGSTLAKIGDINNDNQVNSQDLAIIINTWGSTTDLRGDLNSDGRINAGDLARLISAWGS